MIELDLPALEGLVATLGWTLLHFLWQGAVVGVLFGVSLAAAGNASAQARYRLAFFFLLLLAVLPVATFVWLSPDDLATGVVPEQIGSNALLTIAISAPTLDWQTFVHPWLPWAVLVWAVGVTFMTGRLLIEWRNVRMLTRLDVSQLTPAWQHRVQRLIASLGVRTAVSAVQSARVHVPMVVGWLRPVILVPVSAMSGLTTWQLELILMHELAHVRRYDHLVNLLQVVIETLLFYHPVVRWVSRVMREEREHCCDDLVVSRSGDALAYARALTELAGVQTLSLQTSVASDGGQLLARIRRLVGVRRPPRVAAHWSIGAMLATVALSVSGLLQPLGVNSREADEPSLAPTPAEDTTAGDAQETAGLAFSQPEVLIPEPRAPFSVVTAEPSARPGGAALAPASAINRPAVQTGSAPAAAATAAAAPVDSVPATATSPGGAGAAAAVSDTPLASDEAATQKPTESLVVTAPVAATGSVLDRARMAAVDRVAQENGVKLVWLNPPVVGNGPGSAPEVPSANLADPANDPQARAIAILQARPEFPDRARIDSIEGWVTVSYMIGRDGRVSDVEIVAAQPRNVFEGAVRRAVRSWRFEPVKVDGRAVEQKKTQTIRFSLSDASPGEEMCLASTGSRICRTPGR